MITAEFDPTEEQRAIIRHERSAFINACPGAGKTRTMVERARQLALATTDRRAVAFLSFTTAAIDELEVRLRGLGALPTPLYPNFVGTFDRFLWHFVVAPFGVPGCDKRPRLVPLKNEWEVAPIGAQPLTLRCFDRKTGKIILNRAQREGFDTSKPCERHESIALQTIRRSRQEGLLDFDDARQCALDHLSDPGTSKRLGDALRGRFREIVIDEAQDCNPEDLSVVSWLRKSGIIVKLICDPNQSIYEFRGGVTKELLDFATTFDADDRLEMSGNFRSNPAICSTISMLRPPAARGKADKPLGVNREDATPVHIFSYGGSGVSATIGPKFRTLAEGLGILLADAPVLAKTKASASRAIGQPVGKRTADKTLLLAESVTRYHFAFTTGNRVEALTNFHIALLMAQGSIGARSEYQDFVESEGIGAGTWRPSAITLAKSFKLSPSESAEQWLDRVRNALAPTITQGASINQRLKSNKGLGDVLASPLEGSPTARTIHSAKGMEFPAVCVVLTTQTAGGIIDLLEGRAVSADVEEDAREIYVAASRAERLLALAIPKSRAPRFEQLFTSAGATVQMHDI